MAARKTTASKPAKPEEDQPADNTTAQDGRDGEQEDTTAPEDTTADPELEPEAETGPATDPEPDATAPDPSQAPSGPADPDLDDPQPSGDPAPCTACFPSGWPAPDVTGLGCEHGSWQRPAAT